MPGTPKYISTDPNAGAAPQAASKYLSTDPNAGAESPTSHGVSGSWTPDLHSQNPLSLGGQGKMGQAQQGVWDLADQYRQQDLSNIAHGGTAPSELSNWAHTIGGIMANPTNPGAWATSLSDNPVGANIGADLVGLAGQTATPKNAAIAAGASIPFLRVPIMGGLAAYSSVAALKEALTPKLPMETEADKMQKILLSSGTAVGAGAGTAATAPADLGKIVDFQRRARNVSAVNNAFTGVVQGRLMPAMTRLVHSIGSEIGRAFDTIAQADKAAPQHGPVPMTQPLVDAVKHTVERHYEPMGRVARLYEDFKGTATGNTTGITPQGAVGTVPFDMAQAKVLRTQIGEEYARALRQDRGDDAAFLKTMYDGLTDSMSDRASKLGQGKTFEHYNNESKALFDLKANKIAGGLMEGKPVEAPDMRQVLGEGQSKTTEIGKMVGKGNETAPQDMAQIKDAMSKYGQDVAGWEDAVRQSKVLADAHDTMVKPFFKSMYSAALSGGPLALGAIGTYLALNGLGIYGFAPYLIASAMSTALSRVEPEMAAGRVGSELKGQVPMRAGQTMRPFEGPQAPAGGAAAQGPTGPPVTPDEIRKAADQIPETDEQAKSRRYKDAEIRAAKANKKGKQ